MSTYSRKTFLKNKMSFLNIIMWYSTSYFFQQMQIYSVQTYKKEKKKNNRTLTCTWFCSISRSNVFSLCLETSNWILECCYKTRISLYVFIYIYIIFTFTYIMYINLHTNRNRRASLFFDRFHLKPVVPMINGQKK